MAVNEWVSSFRGRGEMINGNQNHASRRRMRVPKGGIRITMLTNLFTGARAARIEGKDSMVIRQREQPEEFERLRKIALANR